MSALDDLVILEVCAGTTQEARELAQPLVEALSSRGAGVRFENAVVRDGRPFFDVAIRARPDAAPTMSVGVRAADGAPRWIAPGRVPVPASGRVAEVVTFLERWGFIGRAVLRGAS